MLDILEKILWPIIFMMNQVLSFLVSVLMSHGLAIIALSLFMTIISYPIARYGLNFEERYKKKRIDMKPYLSEINKKYKGEEKFLRTEELYKKFNYHPIHSMFSSTSLLVQLPFLISALLLLSKPELTSGISFLFIKDLSQPDGLLYINVLPVMMFAIAMIDSALKPNMDRSAKINYIVLSIVLFALVYGLPSAILLYWLSNNVWSLLMTIYKRRTI